MKTLLILGSIIAAFIGGIKFKIWWDDDPPDDTYY